MFRVPLRIEAKLPLDKREVVESSISLPISPEEELFKEVEDEIARFRQNKNVEDKRTKQEEDLKKEHLRERKDAGRIRKIIRSAVEKNKYRKKR